MSLLFSLICVKIKRVESVVDCLVRNLRVRLGWCLAHLERAPKFAAVIATMDAAASQWARGSVGQPDLSDVMRVMNGELAPLNFDLLSTRHLVSPFLLRGAWLHLCAGDEDAWSASQRIFHDVIRISRIQQLD